MKIVDYRVVTCTLVATLQAEVMTLISEGWQPLGGAFTDSGAWGTEYGQTMVKYENEKIDMYRDTAR